MTKETLNLDNCIVYNTRVPFVWSAALDELAKKHNMATRTMVRERITAWMTANNTTEVQESHKSNLNLSDVRRNLIRQLFPELDLPDTVTTPLRTRKVVHKRVTAGCYVEKVRLPVAVYREYKVRAEAKGMTVNDYITKLLVKAVEPRG